ncbi:MAG: hypothetical protein JNM51_10535 [Bacteroidia bacterium]|nr:hypothetical protein [Bacteroidia bacterium]
MKTIINNKNKTVSIEFAEKDEKIKHQSFDRLLILLLKPGTYPRTSIDKIEIVKFHNLYLNNAVHTRNYFSNDDFAKCYFAVQNFAKTVCPEFIEKEEHIFDDLNQLMAYLESYKIDVNPNDKSEIDIFKDGLNFLKYEVEKLQLKLTESIATIKDLQIENSSIRVENQSKIEKFMSESFSKDTKIDLLNAQIYKHNSELRLISDEYKVFTNKMKILNNNMQRLFKTILDSPLSIDKLKALEVFNGIISEYHELDHKLSSKISINE